MKRAVRSCDTNVCVGAILVQRLAFIDLFRGDRDREAKPEDTAILQYDHTRQRLQHQAMAIQKQAYGIPFHINDDAAVDAACRHHKAMVRVHSSEKLLMPFWLFATSCGGGFKAELLRQNPQLVTVEEKIWMDTPDYQFSYPFEDHFEFNQVSASYLHPSHSVEACLRGTHLPSMMIQRFELLERMEEMNVKAKLIPFVMSTSTALKVVETRITRDLVLKFVNKELRKYHGSIDYANVMLKGVRVDATRVRPVFLPMYRMMVSTRFHGLQVPVYVCGATGKATGPLLNVPKSTKVAAGIFSGVSSTFLSLPLIGPEPAMACGLGMVIASSFILRVVARAKMLKDLVREQGELKTAGMLNFATDQEGFKWQVEDEERSEYEYREELRRRARRKDDFEERVREEFARDEARAQGVKFDPKQRKRNDLRNVDPLGFYKILGLQGKEVGATAKEIQKAFREVSKLHHPDLNIGNEEESKKLMQQILEAYQILRDPQKKKEYDSGRMKTEETES